MHEEAQRLSQLFKLRANKSQAQFGKENGIGSGSMVWQYLNGRRPLSLGTANKFARGLKIDIADFSPRLAEMRSQLVGTSEEKGALGDFARVEYVTLTVDKATRRFATQPSADSAMLVAFSLAWFESRGLDRAALVATECRDEGMSPTLAPGDVVVINTADTEPEDAAVFAVGYEGQVLIRRIFRDEGSWWLSCDNANSHRFMRKHFSDKHCFILGKVVHRQSEQI